MSSESLEYHRHPLPEFSGNPFVEVLAPLPADVVGKTKMLKRRPSFNKEELNYDSSIRRLCTARLKDFMFPMDNHVQILSTIHSHIVGGYKDRNPLTPEGQQSLYKRSASPSTITFITGLSGIGKSALIRSVMSAIGNQVITHSEYDNHAFPYSQILYVMQNVPANATPKGMCMTLGSELDNLVEKKIVTPTFSRNRTHTDFILGLKKSIKHLNTGAIVIDELQNINLKNGANQAEFLSMISNFRDELGAPIIMIGTTAAKEILFSNKHISIQRRFCDGGFFELEPAKSAAEDNWHQFCKTMWRYQWVMDPMEFSDDLCELLYELTQGITGILLTLFINCQMTAIGGQERIDKKLILKVYQEQMRPLHAALAALRSKDPKQIACFDDLYFSGAGDVLNIADSRMNEVERSAAESQLAAAVAIPEKVSKPRRKKWTSDEIAEMRQKVTGSQGHNETMGRIFNG